MKRNNENPSVVRMVRPMGGSLLGPEDTDLAPLSITDDRDFDHVDPRLKDEADLVVTWTEDKPLTLPHIVNFTRIPPESK